ncbi:hypothetical protein BDK51DRAFT_25576 [Blyttiomyces helicus]|uniref:Uncharacterized protein n=1 Tax=Blyttiomyces helicus TaxID=388810 RepID=A0A4P9W6M6_9FUNG|nr:hypothetical protein BDK51DRAFT_25576 [Blyttiomyces helicus]|eukprot:RKO87025.1 hypothetical protein BDK51DRAFT_25576 [Blyttiomyces helicus]
MPSKNAIKFKNGNHLQTELLNQLKDGTRIIILWCSKDKGVEFELSIKENAPEDLDCVMYMAKVTVGVNVTIPEHFSAMFVYGFSLSACVHDIFQATMRSRSPMDLHFFIDNRLASQAPITMTSLITELQFKANNGHKISDTFLQNLKSLVDKSETEMIDHV